MKTDYDEKTWRKAYDKAWLEIFDKLPIEKQELVRASPNGNASMTIGWAASIEADKATNPKLT